MRWGNIRHWIGSHIRLLSYLAASVLTATWTLLQFFTQRTIFDLIGQQVLAQQWLHGGVAGASIGVTNYIPKIFLLYMPLHVLPGSPRLKLILLTVFVNIATIVLLGLVTEKLLRAFGVKIGGAFYGSLIWLAAIAGSVFWIQFTNSRNLEVVGGLFLLYQGLCYLKQPGKWRLGGIAAFGAVLFFADTLQLYMTAIPLILYAITVPRTNKWRRLGWLGAAIVVGFIGSKLLLWLCSRLFSLHFLQAGTSTGFSVHFLGRGIVGTIKSLVHLYSGGAGAGKLREVCNLVFLVGAIGGAVYAVMRKLVPRRLALLAGYILAINAVVYVLSGEAQQTDTERYLIMTAPALVFLFGSLQVAWNRFRTVGAAAICVLLIVNVGFLSKALAQGSRQHFSQDAHLASILRYVSQAKGTLTYASMDTALPMTYLYESSNVPLPLTCSGETLLKDSTFYSKTAYHTHEMQHYNTVAIVLDGMAITNTPNVCSEPAITAQLGVPETVSTTDDGSMVLLYRPVVQTKLHY